MEGQEKSLTLLLFLDNALDLSDLPQIDLNTWTSQIIC